MPPAAFAHSGVQRQVGLLDHRRGRRYAQADLFKPRCRHGDQECFLGALATFQRRDPRRNKIGPRQIGGQILSTA